MERISELPALTLLALDTEDADRPVFFTGDLVSDAKHLFVLALGGQMWDVHHFQEPGQDLEDQWTRWSSRRASLRLLEDFDGCKIEEWLLRYHTYETPSHFL